MEHTFEDIKLLSNSSGCGQFEARRALQKCTSIESALTYILMRGEAFCRYKIVNGKKLYWTDSDYINFANQNPSTRINFNEWRKN